VLGLFIVPVCLKGSLHFLHALAAALLICKHDGHTKTFSVVFEVSPEEKTAIPKKAIQTPKNRGVQCLWIEAEALNSAG